MRSTNELQRKGSSRWIIFLLAAIGALVGAAIWVFGVEAVQRQASTGGAILYGFRFFGLSVCQTTGVVGA
jgi:chromate transport protein ChrA